MNIIKKKHVLRVHRVGYQIAPVYHQGGKWVQDKWGKRWTPDWWVTPPSKWACRRDNRGSWKLENCGGVICWRSRKSLENNWK